MAKTKQCKSCGATANVFVSFVSQDDISEEPFCRECAEGAGIFDSAGFALLDTGTAGDDEQDTADLEVLKCASCGLTQRDFERVGRFGFPQCYDALHVLLPPLLIKIHSGTLHRGKAPRKAITAVRLREAIRILQAGLDKAVEEERFEDAARCRDELAALRKSGSIPNGGSAGGNSGTNCQDRA